MGHRCRRGTSILHINGANTPYPHEYNSGFQHQVVLLMCNTGWIYSPWVWKRRWPWRMEWYSVV